jgi:hypothetical protein
MAFMGLLLFTVPAQAQRHGQSPGQSHGGKQGHSGQWSGDHTDRGHGRNEGRRVDDHYRERHFGRENGRFCDFYGRPTFLFGGIYFQIGLWPDYWTSADIVYVEYDDGDYFLVNESYSKFPRVAILIE